MKDAPSQTPVAEINFYRLIRWMLRYMPSERPSAATLSSSIESIEDIIPNLNTYSEIYTHTHQMKLRLHYLMKNIKKNNNNNDTGMVGNTNTHTHTHTHTHTPKILRGEEIDELSDVETQRILFEFNQILWSPHAIIGKERGVPSNGVPMGGCYEWMRLNWGVNVLNGILCSPQQHLWVYLTHLYNEYKNINPHTHTHTQENSNNLCLLNTENDENNTNTHTNTHTHTH
eukprot:GHVR01051658.1.p1 GENE.GHVR01051658.1~~GHVR01051658.1.p1  ORF type:complete len:229 (-),score=113.13 GHVR01051658.1:156-842(-)